jgi:hypothetical protein
VVETLRKALEWRRQLDAGEVANQATIARREGITRARVTQVLMLLHLAPAIQEYVLNLPKSISPRCISEQRLRPITNTESHREQISGFESVIGASITAARP